MPRVTRNTATAVSNENKIQIKKSSIPVATKRQIAEQIQNCKKPKRKAFGNITNTASETNQDSGKQDIRNQVKKGLNSLVEKRKTSLHSSLRRKNAKKEQDRFSLSNSSSLEGGLVCVTKVKEPEIIKTIVCSDPPRGCGGF